MPAARPAKTPRTTTPRTRPAGTSTKRKGITVTRRFTTAGEDPFASFTFVRRASRIANPDGSVVFEMHDVEVPDTWDQVSTDILASKYFRKAGVPQLDEHGEPALDDHGAPVLGPERSAKQVMSRLADAWHAWGVAGGYFATDADAAAFRDEMAYMLMDQMGAPNTPQFFNTGIFEAYGIVADPEGNWYWDPDRGEAVESSHRHERSAVSACYVNLVEDELVGEGSIFDFIQREARLFKAGSGSGANFSHLRADGERLSAGGTSSGVMSFLKVADAAAGAIKSGGSTRRAAKMVILDADHPDIEEFIWSKVEEERKVAALGAAGYSTDFNGEAYGSVAFQNGNNSVRIPVGFMDRLRADATWALTARTTGETVKELRARELWDAIAEAAWSCADPGLQFDDILNDWNTVLDTERVRGTNPCFTGDTTVATDEGDLTIASLAERAAAGRPLPRALAYDLSGTAVHADITAAWATGEATELVEVTTGDEAALRCTPDHMFLVDGIRMVPAERLTEGDLLTSATAPGATEVAKVRSTRRVTLDTPEAVYDIAVADHHNFMVRSGYGPAVVVSNCSEYTHADDTACNLASLNLIKFWDEDTKVFDVEAYLHACRLFQVMLEVSVSMAHYPSATIARKSYEHRTTGLGYCNLGSLVMRAGLAYDSDLARAVMGAVTSLLTSAAYQTSAELSRAVGPCAAYGPNRNSMLRVLRNHRRAAAGSLARSEGLDDFEDLTVRPVEIDHLVLAHTPFASLSRPVVDQAQAMVAAVEAHGARNMFVSTLAPTGCLVPGSLVLTSEGLLRIGSLGNPDGATWQDLDLAVQTDEGPRRATRFFLNGLSQVVDVTVDRGHRITGTPEHRVKVVDDAGDWVWRRFADLCPGDVVPLRLGGMLGEAQPVRLPVTPEARWTGRDNWIRTPDRMTAELAELVGYFMGDGSLHAKGLRFSVSDADADLDEWIRLTGKDLFGVEAVLEEDRRGAVHGVRLNSVRLAEWWEACGFSKQAPHPNHFGKGYTPRVPDAVLATNDPGIYAAFLRGLFEADASTYATGTTTFVAASREFCDDVQRLLLTLGVSTHRKTGTGGLSGRPTYSLSLFGGEHTVRFFELAGFISERKCARARVGLERSTKRDTIPLTKALLDEVLPPGTAHHGCAVGELRRRIVASIGRAGYRGWVPRHLVRRLAELTGDERVARLCDYVFCTVASAELTEHPVPTFDISVPDNVTYLANGFVSHNTISLLMSGSTGTSGVEPDFALVKLKKLAGGGYLQIVNNSVAPALRTLGYDEDAIDRILTWALGTKALPAAGPVSPAGLCAAGLTEDEVAAVATALPSMSQLDWAFSAYTVGAEAFTRAGLDPAAADGAALLAALGISPSDLRAASLEVCGHLTVEGAPDLRAEHLPVFDCAVECGDGTRSIAWEGHVRALGAMMPHLSGAISKCVTGDTIVPTADGLVRLGSLYRDEEPDSFRSVHLAVSGRSGEDKAESFYYGGVRPTIKVELGNGATVTGTGNHRVLVGTADGLVWKRLDEIASGDHVSQRVGTEMWSPVAASLRDFVPSAAHGSQKPIAVPAEMTPELAFLLGAYAAEGHTTRSNWTVSFTNADEGVLARIEAAIASEFGVAARRVEAHGKCPQVAVSSKTIVEFLEYLGCGPNAHSKAIPQAVLCSPREHVMEFLSGLMLDAYTGADRGSVAICLASRQVIDDLAVVLANAGIRSNRTAVWNEEYQRHDWRLEATGESARLWLDNALFCEQDKATAAVRNVVERPAAAQPDTSDVVPFVSGPDLYHAIPLGQSGDGNRRSDFTFLLDPRTTHTSRATVEKVASLPGVELGDDVRWMLDEGVHFSPVTSIEDAGTAEVFDLSVPGPEAFVGNGIINHNTVNLPNSATVDDVRGAHELSYALGVKCVAIYRDGSKLSQPLNSAKSGVDDLDDAEDRRVLPVEITPGMSPTQFYGGHTPPRFRLPGMRPGITWRIEVGGEEVFLRSGEYKDGTLGEIFIDWGKQGSTMRGLTSALSIAISQGLQHGVPLERFVAAYRGHTFEPRGVVAGHDHLKMADSVIDAIVRVLGHYYLGREDLVQVKGGAHPKVMVTDDWSPPVNPGGREPDAPSGDLSGSPDGAAASGERIYGKTCSNCGGSNLISAGSCAVCGDCGTTTGCS